MRPVDNVFAQTYSHLRYAVLGLLVPRGVVVERPPDARKGWKVQVAVILAHDFLYDDCHLFLVDDVARGVHVCFRIGIKHRGVHAFDGIGKQLEHPIRVFDVRNHISGVYARKRLIM